jgi:hypothetical protein
MENKFEAGRSKSMQNIDSKTQDATKSSSPTIGKTNGFRKTKRSQKQKEKNSLSNL